MTTMEGRLVEEKDQAQTRRDTHAASGVANLRVAIAHEWLVRYAGSERCVAEMLEAFPGAKLLTTVLEASAVPAALRAARASFLQHVPGATRHHEWLLPLMPLAWRCGRPCGTSTS